MKSTITLLFLFTSLFLFNLTFKLIDATDTLMEQSLDSAFKSLDENPLNDEIVHVMQKRSAHGFRPSRHRHHHHHRHYPWHSPNIIPAQNPYVNPFVNTCPNCLPNSYPGSWLNTYPMGMSPFQPRYRRSLLTLNNERMSRNRIRRSN
ncbi:unnamed protein product [Adineta ricciae]|uniref:Transmembrane protein n=1 Tax=Adineta ricciae TaxID=249248 RepID=A0A813NXJ5_ADIRI|nr:unnamed protein product [Adineta ricciae]CAF1238224.1 unnamed protein product [Adineta ricciae]